MSHFKLTHLEIRGFRKFHERSALDLKGPAREPLDYLVLAGPNGSGKTTLLEAILLALGRDDLIVRDLDSPDRSQSPRLRIDDQSVLVARVQDSEESRLLYATRTESGIEVHHQPRGDSWAVPQGNEGGEAIPVLAVEYFSSRRRPALVGPIAVGLHEGLPEDIEANRIWRLKHRIRQQQGRRVPGVIDPEPLDVAWLATLNAFWAQFRGDGSELRTTRVSPDDLDVNEWDLFVFKGAQRVCSVDALSSGEREVISLLAPFITEPFDGLLLIDGPELHLIPNGGDR